MTTGSAAGRAARSSALVQIAAPRDFPAQAPNPRLTTGLDKQPQGTVYNGTLGAFTGGAHRLPHQAIIDIDVRAHLMPSMCKNLRFVCIRQRYIGDGSLPRTGEQVTRLNSWVRRAWHLGMAPRVNC